MPTLSDNLEIYALVMKILLANNGQSVGFWGQHFLQDTYSSKWETLILRKLPNLAFFILMHCELNHFGLII